MIPTRRDLRVFGALLIAFGGLLGLLTGWRPQALAGAAVFLLGAWLLATLFGGREHRTALGLLLPAMAALPWALVRLGAAPAAVGLALAVAGAVAGGGVLLRPELGRRAWTGWLRAAEPIGWSVSAVALAVVYFVVLTPIGLLLRWSGRDALQLRHEPERASYWADLEAEPPERAFRQF